MEEQKRKQANSRKTPQAIEEKHKTCHTLSTKMQFADAHTAAEEHGI